MGYSTGFTGRVTVTPPLNPHEIVYLCKFAGTRRMDRTNGPYYVDGTGPFGQGRDADIIDFNKPDPSQPSLWCGWVPTEDGTGIEWNGVEKFYSATEWMTYLVDHFLKPGGHAQSQPGFEQFTFDHAVAGTIDAQGDDPDDTWQLIVIDNLASNTQSVAF